MLIGEVAFLANMAVLTVVMCLSVYCKSGLPLNMYKYIQIFHSYFKLFFYFHDFCHLSSLLS